MLQIQKLLDKQIADEERKFCRIKSNRYPWQRVIVISAIFHKRKNLQLMARLKTNKIKGKMREIIKKTFLKERVFSFISKMFSVIV